MVGNFDLKEEIRDCCWSKRSETFDLAFGHRIARGHETGAVLDPFLFMHAILPKPLGSLEGPREPHPETPEGPRRARRVRPPWISSARSSAAACPSRLRPAGCAPQDKGRWRLPRPGAGGAAGLLLLFQRRSPCRCQYAKVQEPHPIEACRHIRQPLSGVDSRRTRRKRQGLS
ncbi:hypothetical protein GFM02_09775 [Rhizobium leguminosarum bv. viciae]|nr:hypothetical protein [Rhizobium leguminosarum bv. viciae]